MSCSSAARSVGPSARRIAAGHRAARPGRALVRRADDHAVEVGQRMPARRRLAQPRARPVGDGQVLAQQLVGEPRQIGAEPTVLGQRRAQRVDHQVGLLAHGLQQTHRPGKARGIELERIGDGAGDAAHDQVDRHQAFERLQGDAIADHAQVAALHQQQAEVAGQIGVAEEIVVARARRQQGDARVGAIGAPRQRRLHLLEERRQPLRVAGTEDVAGDVGVHHAVGERVADAGRRLDVRVDHAPAAVGAARQVGGEELDVAAGRPQMLAGPQIGRIAEHQLMRNGARSPAGAAVRRGRPASPRTGGRAGSARAPARAIPRARRCSGTRSTRHGCTVLAGSENRS